MTRKELQIVVDTYNELLHSHQLNIELLETLELTLLSVKDFCIKNNIPFGNAKIGALISKTDTLLDEIGQKSTDEFLQRKKSDKDFTEPFD